MAEIKTSVMRSAGEQNDKWLSSVESQPNQPDRYQDSLDKGL